MRIMTFVLALTLLPFAAQAQDKVDTSKVEDQAKAMGKAVLDGDFEKIAELKYPKVVEARGGKEKLVEQTKAAVKAIKDQGFSVQKFNIGKAGDAVVEEKTAYVVVPTTVELAGPGAKIVADSYLLGITTDQGKTWTFADEDEMGDPTIKDKAFPKLPTGLKLPAKKPPMITKEKEKVKEKDEKKDK